MVTRFAMATVAVLLGSGSAYAQARMSLSPLPALGMTSPLGIPNAPVGQTGIPIDRHSLRSLTGYDGLPLTDVEVLDVRRPESAAPRDVAADARIAIRGKLTC